MTQFSPRGFGGMALLCAGILCPAAGAVALELDFPGEAELVLSVPSRDGQHPVATGPWAGASVPTEAAEGVVREFVWQVHGEDLNPLAILATLREQLTDQGYALGFTCAASACGGFDFRHTLPMGPAPEMHVDLGNFHYVTAYRDGEAGTEHATLTVSQGGTTGFVHLALVQPADLSAEPVTPSTRSPDLPDAVVDLPGVDGDAPEEVGDLIAELANRGAAPLEDLVFESGASSLSGERYPSLVALAAFLTADEERRVVLVGHTDAMGSLAGNIQLSEARANAVRRFLIDELGVRGAQVEAEGIGFLSPRAPNTTPEGRDANRRVEVVLVSGG